MGFFYLNKLETLDDDILNSYCIKLENYLTHDNSCDIDGNQLFCELKILKTSLPKETKKIN